MPEYIEREALLAELEDEIDFVSPFYNAEQNQYFTMGLRCAYRDAQRFPAADVVEVRHGKWVETQEPLGWRDVNCAECSVCHESWIIDEDSSIDDYEYMWHYCPNCGAKMDGGKNDDSKKSVRASE